MTSYSTYGAGRIRFVDGDLTHEDPERREEERDQLINCLASGAARTLLDCAQDLDNETRIVHAEEWHSEEQGWELDALDDDARAKVRSVTERFVDANVPWILLLAEYLAYWDRPGSIWSGDLGMALYRVGQLLGYQCAGTGITLDDYSQPAGRRLYVWAKEHASYAFESPFISSSEQPCRLHIGA